MSKEIIDIPKFSELERCFYPIRADPYYKGCKHDCIYCYSKAINSRFPNSWNIDNVSIGDMEGLKKLFYSTFNEDKKGRKQDLLRNRIPLRLGGITDVFQPIEKEKKITLELIKLLNSYNYPYMIVTKSSLVGEENYLNIIRRDLAYVQISITTLDDKQARIIEPQASSINERINCMQTLINNGIYTAARISPIIPIHPDGYYSQFKNSNQIDKEDITNDFFSFDLVETLCKMKPNTVLIEFLRVSPMIKKILISENLSGIINVYNNISAKGADGTLHLSLEEKKFYCNKIKNICNKFNVDFTVCDDNNYNGATRCNMKSIA
ncbi:MAG: radical SAM protein [Clostridium sp.]